MQILKGGPGRGRVLEVLEPLTDRATVGRRRFRGWWRTCNGVFFVLLGVVAWVLAVDGVWHYSGFIVYTRCRIGSARRAVVVGRFFNGVCPRVNISVELSAKWTGAIRSRRCVIDVVDCVYQEQEVINLVGGDPVV